MAHILVFGTSTTYGAWDSEGGWVQRLRGYLDEKYIKSGFKKGDHLVYNLGVSGDKSEDILKRFVGETEARIDEECGTVILFHLGVNDSIYSEKLKTTEISAEKFKDNLAKLINLAKKYTEKIIVLGSMPVDKRVDPIPWSPGRSYKNEYVEKFNEIMEDVSKSEEVNFIEVFKKFINDNYSTLLADGVHMNDEGHKQLYKLVKDKLLEKKII